MNKEKVGKVVGVIVLVANAISLVDTVATGTKTLKEKLPKLSKKD